MLFTAFESIGFVPFLTEWKNLLPYYIINPIFRQEENENKEQKKSPESEKTQKSTKYANKNLHIRCFFFKKSILGGEVFAVEITEISYLKEIIPLDRFLESVKADNDVILACGGG